MNNSYAYRISKAVDSAKRGGDFIDHGWSLVKAMHAAGFVITPIDRSPAGLSPYKTLNEMCGLSIEELVEAGHLAEYRIPPSPSDAPTNPTPPHRTEAQ